jgi:hypothetical protein
MQGKYPMLTPKNKTPSSVTPAPLFIKTSITLFFQKVVSTGKKNEKEWKKSSTNQPKRQELTAQKAKVRKPPPSPVQFTASASPPQSSPLA